MQINIDDETTENIRALRRAGRKFRRACDFPRAIKFEQMAHDLAAVALVAEIDRIDESNKEQGE